MTDAVVAKTYSIPEIKLNSLRARLDKMVRKAQKLGIESCSYSVGETCDIPYIRVMDDLGAYRTARFEGDAAALALADKNGKIFYHRFVEVTVSGPNPVLADWEFVATLQHLQDDQGKPMNILRVRPGFEQKLPERFHDSSSQLCDHCHQHRARKDTYVVRNIKTGDWKQVGSTCIKDSCGGNDPRQVAAMLEWFLDADRTCTDESYVEGGGSGLEGAYSLRLFLAVTNAVIRRDGWVSRAKARDENRPATADVALCCLEKFSDSIDNKTTLAQG